MQPTIKSPKQTSTAPAELPMHPKPIHVDPKGPTLPSEALVTAAPNVPAPDHVKPGQPIPTRPDVTPQPVPPIEPPPQIRPGDPTEPPMRVPPGDPVSRTAEIEQRDHSRSAPSNPRSTGEGHRPVKRDESGEQGHPVKQAHGVPPQPRVPERSTRDRLEEDIRRSEGEGMTTTRVPDPPSSKPRSLKKDTEEERRLGHVAH